MSHNIDIHVLRDVLSGSEAMVRYYADSETKAAQNAALVAAGLPPLHTESSLKWDREQLERRRREVDCLKAVIAFFGGDEQAEAA